MSAWSHAKNAVQMFEVVVKGLEIIQDLTNLGGNRADEALSAIRGVIGSLKRGFAGEVTPAEVRAQITQLNDRIAQNNATADEALRKKFEGEAP